MKQQGLANSLFDISQIDDKLYHIYRKIFTHAGSQHLRYHWTSVFNRPYNRHVHDMLSLLNKDEVMDKLYLQRPSLLLSLENELLTWKVFERFAYLYRGGSLPMPKRHFYYRFINYYRQDYEPKLDYIYYTLPIEPNTYQYVFPSEYVGQYGVYYATRELYKRSPEASQLLKEHSIYTHQKNHQVYTERIVSRVRQEFREKNAVPEDGVLVFVNPGNEKREAEFCLEECRRGVEEFRRKYFSPTSLEPRAMPRENLITYMPIQKNCNLSFHPYSWLCELHKKFPEK
eukprot:TRINITY_DN6093_c0_g1_i19.p1 TRINITY_DN6093_c0_g1~~TRINITY_DN6093_c0_g1_i19.p1  ORF type:complete len:286 (-),score=75.05 TRINITY_DN6093_c0_g1_i19:691-1548(-)